MTEPSLFEEMLTTYPAEKRELAREVLSVSSVFDGVPSVIIEGNGGILSQDWCHAL